MSDRGAYRNAGVDYAVLDEGKRSALAAAASTSSFMSVLGGASRDESRGEPAFVFNLGGKTLALVVEGLGTKSVAAREIQEEIGENHFHAVAYDSVAAVLNDLICVGALPLVLNAYFATGLSDWYSDHTRYNALLEGWTQACVDASCTWGGGESPTLPGLVTPGEIELAGAAVGLVPDNRPAVLGQELKHGDEIVIVSSSGMHANGASLARSVAAKAADGWSTRLPDGRQLSEAIMAPSLLYVQLVRNLYEANLDVHYLSHITGHGLQKIMRPQQRFTYRLTALPPVPSELAFLADASEMNARDAYSTLNMGCGMAVYVPAGTGNQVVAEAARLNYQAIVAGTVEDGDRQVILEPLSVIYSDEDMSLTAAAK